MILPLRYANNTNATFSFHGPRGADEDPGPVKWIRPYFDCGRSNEWKFAAAVPVVDIYPRHTRFRHIEYPSYTGVAVLEMNFERVDINQVSHNSQSPFGYEILPFVDSALFSVREVGATTARTGSRGRTSARGTPPSASRCTVTDSAEEDIRRAFFFTF